MPTQRPHAQQREAGQISARARRTRRLVRELAATPALTRDQRAAVLAAAAGIPVLDGAR